MPVSFTVLWLPVDFSSASLHVLNYLNCLHHTTPAWSREPGALGYRFTDWSGPQNGIYIACIFLYIYTHTDKKWQAPRWSSGNSVERSSIAMITMSDDIDNGVDMMGTLWILCRCSMALPRAWIQGAEPELYRLIWRLNPEVCGHMTDLICSSLCQKCRLQIVHQLLYCVDRPSKTRDIRNYLGTFTLINVC